MSNRAALGSSRSTREQALDAALRREIEPGAIDAFLNLDNPQIGIEGDFPFEPLLRLAGVDEHARMSASEDPVDARRRVRDLGLRRGSIERRPPVQMIDFDENRAGFRGAATAEDRARPFHSASTQIGGDPDVGAQAQRASVPLRARRWPAA
jgi:hypothetical protein